MEHGPGKPDRETILEMVERPTLLSVWLQGFAAADNAERPACPRRNWGSPIICPPLFRADSGGFALAQERNIIRL